MVLVWHLPCLDGKKGVLDFSHQAYFMRMAEKISMEKQEEISCKQHMNETWWLFQCYNMPRCKIVKLMAKTPKAVLISFGVFFLHCLGFVIYFFSLCVHSIQKENVCFLLQLKNACLRYKHCVLLTLFNEKNGTYIERECSYQHIASSDILKQITKLKLN